MQLWEYHRDLSLLLGDSVGLEHYSRTGSTAIPNNYIIPDGVRYGTSLRNSALYRAELELIQEMIKSVVQLDIYKSNDIIEGLFSNMVLTDSTTLVGYSYPFPQNPIYIFSVTATQNNLTYPVPLKLRLEHNALVNSRIAQQADMYCYLDNLAFTSGNPVPIQTTLKFIDKKSEFSNPQIDVRFLPYPVHPDTLATTDELAIEEMYSQKVLTLAELYLLTAGQDIVHSEQFMAMELGLAKGGQ